VIRSMTGFAAVSRTETDHTIHVTLKSVNHRFLDLAVKAPSSLSAIELQIRAVLSERLARGRVEIAIVVESTLPPERQVVVDERLVKRVESAIASLRQRGAITGALSVSDLLHIPHAIDVRPPAFQTGPAPGIADLTLAALEEATSALIVMRETEGRLIEADLTARLRTIQQFVDVLEITAREGQHQLEGRLRERLDALPGDLRADPNALARELVRFVSRSDIDEETVRLRSHLEHWRGLTSAPEPCGRQLDFLVQEMNREVNTIGSKVEHIRATDTVIAVKAELERIREQVQNVE
jgi:uncharacterized protein (TIGR00255 family)